MLLRHGDDRYVNDDDDIFIILLFSLYFICLNFASFLTDYLPASISFLNSTIHDEVRKSNARKDCLVCSIGVIAGGHYDQGRD